MIDSTLRMTLYNSETRIKFGLVVSLLLLIVSAAFAQTKQNSPYSRYGIGDPLPHYFPSHAAMGGVTAGFHDPYHLNLANPASYAFLRATSLETGLYAKRSRYDSGEETRDIWSGNMSYLALGFTLKSPINEVLDRSKSPWQFGMGFALTPYSLIGYDVSTAQNFSGPEFPDVDSIANNFIGSGGSYRLVWTSAAKYKNTAFGVNLGWLFGKAQYENTTTFIDSFPTFQNNFRDDIGMNGFIWGLGVQHDLVLKRDKNNRDLPIDYLTVGLSMDGVSEINTRTDVLRIRSRGRLTNGQYQSADTLFYQPGQVGALTLPMRLRAGVRYVHSTKFNAGIEYGFEQGSAYENNARPDSSFRNASSFSFGVEFTPDRTSYNNYLKRIRYRFGGYYRQDIRVINGEGLNDIGLSAGLGFPIILPRKQTTFINTAFEIGRLGAGTAIEENYYRITVGFTLNDNYWFYKRRFE